MYLTNEAVESTLGTVATCVPGSQVVFEYSVPKFLLDDLGREFREHFVPVANHLGEALYSRWSPSDIEFFVQQCGLETVDHPSRGDLVERYFAGRDDGLQPGPVRACSPRRCPRRPMGRDGYDLPPSTFEQEPAQLPNEHLRGRVDGFMPDARKNDQIGNQRSPLRP